MFEVFLASYSPGSDCKPSRMWTEPHLLATPGYVELAAKVAGLTLGGGMFRFLDDENGPTCRELVGDVFPEYAKRAVPFAIDWTGRLFAIDCERGTDAGLHLILLDPAGAEILEIDEILSDFLNVDFIEDPERFLDSELFDDWRSSGGTLPSANQCVGFKLPLFLNGAVAADNLEISDLEVYWSICGQLYQQVKDLPDGTVIAGITPPT